MTENPYSPEKPFPAGSETGTEAMANRVEQAPPPADNVPPLEKTSDQTEMQNELGRRSYDSFVEAGSRVNYAEAARVGNQIEAPKASERYSTSPAIAVKGFENSGMMSNEDVKNYLENTLPPDHIRGDKITDISYPNRYDGDARGVTLGMCTTDRVTHVSQIDVYNQTPEGSSDRSQMEYTLTHEVGHNVRYNLAPEQQQQWDRISQASRPDQYVTNYARTNTNEDFSESYAHYVRDPEKLLETHPGKYAFMRDVVFHGRQYAA